MPIRVISPEALYALKCSSGREQDRIDADELKKALGSALDIESVARWLDESRL